MAPVLHSVGPRHSFLVEKIFIFPGGPDPPERSIISVLHYSSLKCSGLQGIVQALCALRTGQSFTGCVSDWSLAHLSL